jgi:two-component system NtrC family response regulator
MADGPSIEPADLGFNAESILDEEDTAAPHFQFNLSGMKLKDARSYVEKNLIAEALDSTDGNILKASECLGVSRPTLYDLMKKYNFYVKSASES